MSIPAYRNEKTANEVKIHRLLKDSFVEVGTAGMRLAPEVLVLELFREVFFESHYGESFGTKELNPEDGQYQESEKAVLYALQGRRKQTNAALDRRFYAPAYWSLARGAWLGRKRERVINNFLFKGPLATYLWHRGPDVAKKKQEWEQITDDLVKALIGHKSVANDGEAKGKEILSVAIRDSGFPNTPEREDQARRNVTEAISPGPVVRVQSDMLAERITRDLLHLCQLEKAIPRLQWIGVLMAFLRFALPVWLLAQLKITTLLHTWLLDAVGQGNILAEAEIRKQLGARNLRLLQPTITGTRDLFESIEKYMKHRVELNILMYQLEDLSKDGDDIKKKSTLVVDGGNATLLTVSELLRDASRLSNSLRQSERYREVAGDLDVRTFLTREGENFAAWRYPLKKGQGKNIDEFLRVMYKAATGDDTGGFLLVPVGRQSLRGFIVFPGQLLLKTVVYLAAQEKYMRGGGKLLLEDVETHFQEYGVDFAMAADARPFLVQELQVLGLLRGSPDAGSSVAVATPYQVERKG